MVCLAKLEPQIIIAKVVKELSKVAGEEMKSHKNVAMSLLNCDGQTGNERAESCGGGRGEAPPVSLFFFQHYSFIWDVYTFNGAKSVKIMSWDMKFHSLVTDKVEY